MKIHTLTLTALFAALLCIISPWAVPVGPIPISLATFGIYLISAVGGWRSGTLAVIVYLLIGTVGAPVFAGFRGGAQTILGPTGGYLMGYIVCALCVGDASDRFDGRRPACLIGMIVGTILLYALGTIWYMSQTSSALEPALLLCVLPFLPGDAVKIAAACVLAPLLRRRLYATKK